MKTIYNFVLAAVAILLLYTPCLAQTGSEPTTKRFSFIACDVNSDNAVDISDINSVISVILQTSTDSVLEAKSDINGDGVVDIADINGVISFLLNPPRAAITWIDDEHGFFDWNDGGRLRPIYQKFHDFCMEHGIRFDIARGPLCTPYDFRVIQFQLDECLKWQSDGFHYLYHPNHSMGWYDYDPEHMHDASKIEESAIDCIKGFEYYGFDAPSVLVWPGDSHKFSDNYPIAEKLFECAISASYTGTNHLGENNRYCLKRFSLECLRMGYLTKSQFKQQLKEAVDRGDWIILGSHIIHVKDSDVPDDTSYNLANLFEIIQYADSLCHIRPTADVWAERKYLWGL